jgi:lysosomal Pro-X carboxypeptidase
MPLGGNNEESIFPANKWELEDTISYCKHEYHIVPRPHWITTEFGGQVRNQYFNYF